MLSTKKKIFGLGYMIGLIVIGGLFFSVYATDEIGGTISNGIDQGLTVALPCNPSTVTHGTVNSTTCAITCDSNYTLDGSSCTANQGGGGGGGGGTSEDACLSGDLSPSRYDGLCTGTITSGITGGNATGTISNNCSIIGSPFSTEFNQGYQYACNLGITTMPTIQQANMEGTLLRSHMAKMMVNYAIKVLHKTPDTSLTCTFDDSTDESAELQGYIKLACQLGLMGIDMTSFYPNGTVTRAEFGTILSRALYGSTYNGGVPYYSNHLQALLDHDIITNIDPTLLELRGYVMLMLMRAAK